MNNLKNSVNTINSTVKGLPNRISAIPQNISSLVTDKVEDMKEGFENTIDSVKHLPDQIVEGIEDTLTKPDGLLDRAGLVDDNGELRDLTDIRETAVKTTNANIKKVGDNAKKIAEIANDRLDTLMHASAVGVKQFLKNAGYFIKDNTKQVAQLATDFAKNFVKNQLELTGVTPYIKKNWQWFGLGSSAILGGYLFTVMGSPIFAVKSQIGNYLRIKKIGNQMQNFSNILSNPAISKGAKKFLPSM